MKSLCYKSFNYKFHLFLHAILGPMSLLSLWSNRINTANSRKHQEFIGRLNSVNNKAELYQHLKEENGFVSINVSLLLKQ